MPSAQTPPTTSRQDAMLARRAAIARRLVKNGLFDPDEALAVTVWPTDGEQAVFDLAADEWVLLHGTVQGYKDGCRCAACRGAKQCSDRAARKRSAA